MLKFLTNAPLGKYCTFLAGGRAEKLAFAYSRDELCEGADGGALVLGRGSNVLIGDEGYAGTVVVNRTSAFEFSERLCECDSGVLMSVLAREYAGRGRTGLEWAYGLPGTAGGAAVGNAGAFGGCMADVVQSVTVLRGGKIVTLSADECGFDYRASKISGTVLSLCLKAESGDEQSITKACENNLARRKATQPGGASAGSVFKAAGDTAAGLLIERAGLKGFTAGGAQISPVHANFIVNRGGASSGDILYLMNVARAVVYDRFGTRLEREIKLYGDF